MGDGARILIALALASVAGMAARFVAPYVGVTRGFTHDAIGLGAFVLTYLVCWRWFGVDRRRDS